MNRSAEEAAPRAEAAALELARRHFDALQAAAHAGHDTAALRAQQEDEVRRSIAGWSKTDVPRLLAIYAREVQSLSVRARATRSAEAAQAHTPRRFHWPFVAAALLTVSVIAAVALPSCSPRH